MLLASVIGILMVPVTFAVVEYLSHRFGKGGKGTTMDSTHEPEDQDAEDATRSATSNEHKPQPQMARQQLEGGHA